MSVWPRLRRGFEAPVEEPWQPHGEDQPEASPMLCPSVIRYSKGSAPSAAINVVGRGSRSSRGLGKEPPAAAAAEGPCGAEAAPGHNSSGEGAPEAEATASQKSAAAAAVSPKQEKTESGSGRSRESRFGVEAEPTLAGSQRERSSDRVRLSPRSGVPSFLPPGCGDPFLSRLFSPRALSPRAGVSSSGEARPPTPSAAAPASGSPSRLSPCDVVLSSSPDSRGATSDLGPSEEVLLGECSPEAEPPSLAESPSLAEPPSVADPPAVAPGVAIALTLGAALAALAAGLPNNSRARTARPVSRMNCACSSSVRSSLSSSAPRPLATPPSEGAASPRTRRSVAAKRESAVSCSRRISCPRLAPARSSAVASQSCTKRKELAGPTFLRMRAMS
mmetsp:Transcript_3695/g.12422  ORF Transcript_3695/g.12422 Transcript_3695/m.12422 type:complete len:390 (+) Transcript_3695:897-2066(+)